MASLGDTLLAVAGGAADAYNEDVARRRQKELDMMARTQEIAKMAQMRLIETQFNADLTRQQSEYEMENTIETMGGRDHPNAKRWYLVNKLGWTPEEANKAIIQGHQIPSIPKTRNGSQNPLEYAMSLVDQISQGNKGNKRLPRRLMSTAERKYTHNPSTFEVDDVAMAINNQEGPFSGDDVKRSNELFAQEKAQMERERLIKEFEERQKAAPKVDVSTSSDAVVTSTVDTETGEILRTERVGFEKPEKPRVHFSTLVENGQSREFANVFIPDPNDPTKLIQTQQLDLGEKPVRDMRTDEARKAVKEELFTAGRVTDTIDTLSKFMSAEEHGVGGLITNVTGAIHDLYISIPGLPKGIVDKAKQKGEVVATPTLALYMSRAFSPEQAEQAQTFLERRMAQGANQVLETILLYNYAKLLKPEGKLNVDDIQRVENMFSKGISGGPASGNAIAVAKSMAHSIATARIRQVLVETDEESGFTGAVVYDTRDKVWKYNVEKDGKSSWKTFK